MAGFIVFLLPVGGVCFHAKILAPTGVSWEGRWRVSPWPITIFGETHGSPTVCPSETVLVPQVGNGSKTKNFGLYF
jgi:hypothetical protein